MSQPADLLLEIVERRRQRLGLARDPSPPETTVHAALAASHPFLVALERRRGRAIIAEVKMGSPRLGSLDNRIDPEKQARLYRDNGAAALSVVVEPDYFGGSYELLKRCKRASGLPALAKDFVVGGSQLEEAARAGADAVLLIAALQTPDSLFAWACRARALGMVPLIETHDAEDRAKLGSLDWELVGVNNRDLRTFEVDIHNSIAAVPELPPRAMKVSESGIGKRSEVVRLANEGFDAFLVGESLLLARDPAAKLAELTGKES